MSSLKLSDEHTSPPATPGSRGVHVANSHFSKISARSGNRGCLQQGESQYEIKKISLKLNDISPETRMYFQFEIIN